jgi:single-strand DNA-binding protein
MFTVDFPRFPHPVQPEGGTMEAVNVSVLRGAISGPPEIRALKSGRRIATLAVRTSAGDGRNTSVPVTVWDPPAWVETLATDDDVLVVGRVRRRFFRTATGASGARTDVEAESVAPARDRRRLAALLRRVDRELERLDETE